MTNNNVVKVWRHNVAPAAVSFSRICLAENSSHVSSHWKWRYRTPQPNPPHRASGKSTDWMLKEGDYFLISLSGLFMTTLISTPPQKKNKKTVLSAAGSFHL